MDDPIIDICGMLMGLQRDRVFAIKSAIAGNNQAEAYIRTKLGYSTDADEPERKRLAKLATRIREDIEKGKDNLLGEALRVAPAVRPFVDGNALARLQWETLRENSEEEMERLARQLPVWPWASQVLGLSALGLAVVVGEAHDLRRYPKKGHLWTRMMLGMFDGKRQGFVPAGLSKDARREAYEKHQYNPARKGRIYSFLYDSLLRAQYRAARDEDGVACSKSGNPEAVPAHALGPYGTYYLTKKAEYVARFTGQKGANAHADMAARRYMAKMFLRDLLAAWKATAAAA